MKMKVVDQLHLSMLGPEVMPKGREFEVSDALGKELEQKGLATRVVEEAAQAANESAAKEEKQPISAAKAEPNDLLNKAEAPPSNKAEKTEKDHPHKRGK